MSDLPPSTDLYSIGDVSALTGLSPHTIRVWEKRYGQPVAERLPSGHRRYLPATVNLLRAASELVAYGHRPSQILNISHVELLALLQKERADHAPTRSGTIDRAIGLSGKSLRLLLDASMREIGVRQTIHELIVPLLQRIGEAWAEQEINIYQEHILSEAIEDALRATRLQIPVPKTSEYYVDLILVTMTGERHGLGLQILALLAALKGVAVLVLGVDLPTDEIAQVAQRYPEAAVAVSISSAADVSLTIRQLSDLRSALPEDTQLIAGGAGMVRRQAIPGVLPMANLADFEAWLPTFAAAENSSTNH